jgi:hypothetical protein
LGTRHVGLFNEGIGAQISLFFDPSSATICSQSIDPNGTLHGVLSQSQYNYLDAVANHGMALLTLRPWLLLNHVTYRRDRFPTRQRVYVGRNNGKPRC